MEKIYEALNPLIGLAKVCGIAGLSFGVLLIIFQQIISKAIFSKFTKLHSYKIIRLIILCSFGLSFLGIIIYGFLKFQESKLDIQKLPTDTLKYEPLKLEKKGVIIIDSTKKKK